MKLEKLKMFVAENFDVISDKKLSVGWRALYHGKVYGDHISFPKPTLSQPELVEAINLLLTQALGCIETLENEASADTGEAKHGNTICKDHDEWWGAVYECSICGGEWMLNSNYRKAICCPHCGAKMKGGEEE